MSDLRGNEVNIITVNRAYSSNTNCWNIISPTVYI